MFRTIAIIVCSALMLIACGKSESKKQAKNTQPAAVSTVEKTSDGKSNVDTVYFEDSFSQKIGDNKRKFKREFKKLSEAQKYYFCAAFAMGAMSASKPVTASVMVTYFMGLGVAKYGVGISDHTYTTFNAGKNIFRYESLINDVLESKICENIINSATEYAVEKNMSVAQIDKLGRKEVEKAIYYIEKQKLEAQSRKK